MSKAIHPYVREKFMEWLLAAHSTKPHKPIGRSCGSDICPLGKCFGIAVDQLGYKIPPWADEYIWRQDAIYSDGRERPIYPKRALEILDAIP